MSLVQLNGMQDVQVMTVYYAGTNTLQEGAPVYFDLDDTNAPIVDSWDPSVDPGPNSLSTTANRNLRGYRVFDVNVQGSTGSGTQNSGQLAGVVAKTSAGKVGPGFIDIVRAIPGAVCNVLIGYNNGAKGDMLEPDESTPSNTFAKFAAQGVTTAITGANLALVKMVLMQTGPSSGVTTSAPATVLAKFI